MFDDRDVDFHRTRAEPRLGVPVLTAKGMIFLSEDRFGFDEYNTEFMSIGAMPRLPPPAMFADGFVRCLREDQRYRKYGVWYKRDSTECR